MIKIPITLEDIEKYWYYPATILILDIVLMLFILSLVGFNLYSGILCLVIIMPLTYYWRRSTRLPKNEGAIGILLAIRSESTVDREKFENDFIKVLEESTYNKFKGLETKSYSLPEYYCDKINSKTVSDYLLKTNTHFCIYGSIKQRKFDEKYCYILNLDSLVRHRRTSTKLKKRITQELNELIPPANLALSVNKEYVSFLALTEWLKIYIFYNLVTASTISLDHKTAQELLDSLKIILESTNLDHPVVQKISSRIEQRQLDIYTLESELIYPKWRSDRKIEYVERLKKLSVEALSIKSGLESFIVQLAITGVVLGDNLDQVLKLLIPFKKSDIVKLNMAFIQCLKSNFKRVYSYYEETDFSQISIDQINQIEEFAEWFLNSKKRKELYLILSMINIFGKGDYIKAKEDFNSFFEFAKNNHVQIDEKLLDKIRNKIQLKLNKIEKQ